jgi:hypothetical protein
MKQTQIMTLLEQLQVTKIFDVDSLISGINLSFTNLGFYSIIIVVIVLSYHILFNNNLLIVPNK